MSILVRTAKRHRVQVKDAKRDSKGSITIDPVLMNATGIVPFPLLHISGLSNAAHWETYAIPGRPGTGEFCLNG